MCLRTQHPVLASRQGIDPSRISLTETSQGDVSVPTTHTDTRNKWGIPRALLRSPYCVLSDVSIRLQIKRMLEQYSALTRQVKASASVSTVSLQSTHSMKLR